MIVHHVSQGTPEWLACRLGIPTASRFAEIITPKTLKPSTQARACMLEKLAEWALGEPADGGKSGFMDRGSGLEAEALAYYSFQNDVQIERVGFVTTDDGLAGCSPDGLIGTDGGIEVKVYSATHHLDVLLSEPDMLAHKAQIQGNMSVCERQWWVRWFWHPVLPSIAVRFERDAEYIDALEAGLKAFHESLEEAKKCLLSAGFNPKAAPKPKTSCKFLSIDGTESGSVDDVQWSDGLMLCAKCRLEVEALFA